MERGERQRGHGEGHHQAEAAQGPCREAGSRAGPPEGRWFKYSEKRTNRKSLAWAKPKTLERQRSQVLAAFSETFGLAGLQGPRCVGVGSVATRGFI